MEEAVRVEAGRGQEVCVPSLQFCCELKTVLKKNKVLKKARKAEVQSLNLELGLGAPKFACRNFPPGPQIKHFEITEGNEFWLERPLQRWAGPELETRAKV